MYSCSIRVVEQAHRFVAVDRPIRAIQASGTPSASRSKYIGTTSSSRIRCGDNGWAIGGRETLQDEAAQDWADAMDLYRILEGEVVPEYYDRDASGIPVRWVERMRRSIATTLWQFSTTRMLHEYTERLYLPAAGIELKQEAGVRP